MDVEKLQDSDGFVLFLDENETEDWLNEPDNRPYIEREILAAIEAEELILNVDITAHLVNGEQILTLK